MDFVVHSAQIILVALASYLTWIVVRLANRDKPESSVEHTMAMKPISNPSRPLPRIESIAQLQMFAGSQMLELRLNGLEPASLRKKEWLLVGISHYFRGACRSIAVQFSCTEADIADLMHFVLRRSLGLSFDEASRMIANLEHAPEEEFHQHASTAGQEAASSWLREKRVNEEFGLFNSIAEWGVTV
jgi:hypothetical protein